LKLSHCAGRKLVEERGLLHQLILLSQNLSFWRFQTVNDPIDFHSFLGNGPNTDVVRRAREAQLTIRGSAALWLFGIRCVGKRCRE
jgi:hypothetical protein